MALLSNQNTGQKAKAGRELRRQVRDRKIFGKLRALVTVAEQSHYRYDEQIEPLSVFYGKQDKPASWQLSPFPMGKQGNGKPLPRWEDLSQWMKVMMATMVCHQWDLLTFNINLHPELENELVTYGNVRVRLSERVRKHLSRAIGNGREFFFVIEAHSKDTGTATYLHIHGAIATYAKAEQKVIKQALAKAAGHDLSGRHSVPRAVHTRWFKEIRMAYVNYLFKFAKRFDDRIDRKRLVMSQAMTSAARMFWIDIARPDLS